MENNQQIITVLNWDVGEWEFMDQVEAMIKIAENYGKSLPLPVALQTGEAFVGQVALLLAAVNCKECSADCCRHAMDQNDEGIGLLPDEMKLFQQVGAKIIDRGAEGSHTPYPCPFYSGEEFGDCCAIYKGRPLSCMLFPFQPGGFMGEHAEIPTVSINAKCPEGKRLTRFIYHHVYIINHKLENFAGLGG